MNPDPHPTGRRYTFEEGVAAFGMFLMLVLICAEIVAREAFNESLRWSEEVARYLMIWSVYFGASAAVALEEHLRIDLLVARASPTMRRRLNLLAHLWVLAFSLAITYAGFLYVRDSFAFGFVSSESSLTVELGWIQLVIPVTFALSCHPFDPPGIRRRSQSARMTTAEASR